MENFESLGILGEGTYGVVMKARHRETGQIVAIKKFKYSDEDPQTRNTALREVRMLKQLSHENIISLLDVFRRDGKYCLVFEFAEHTLLNYIEKSRRGLKQSDVRRFTYQLLRGLEFCHANDIIHRDVKPENVLISKEGIVKLCDFGFARQLLPHAQYTDYVATRWYRSPELLVGDVDYSKPVDVWAVGCIFSELSDSQPLFPGESDLDQLAQIMRCTGRLPARLMRIFKNNRLYKDATLPSHQQTRPLRRRFSNAPPDWMEFLEACLQNDPEKRATCTELMQLPYFTRGGFRDEYEKELSALCEKESNRCRLRHVQSKSQEAGTPSTGTAAAISQSISSQAAALEDRIRTNSNGNGSSESISNSTDDSELLVDDTTPTSLGSPPGPGAPPTISTVALPLGVCTDDSSKSLTIGHRNATTASDTEAELSTVQHNHGIPSSQDSAIVADGQPPFEGSSDATERGNAATSLTFPPPTSRSQQAERESGDGAATDEAPVVEKPDGKLMDSSAVGEEKEHVPSLATETGASHDHQKDPPSRMEYTQSVTESDSSMSSHSSPKSERETTKSSKSSHRNLMPPIQGCEAHGTAPPSTTAVSAGAAAPSKNGVEDSRSQSIHGGSVRVGSAEHSASTATQQSVSMNSVAQAAPMHTTAIATAPPPPKREVPCPALPHLVPTPTAPRSKDEVPSEPCGHPAPHVPMDMMVPKVSEGGASNPVESTTVVMSLQSHPNAGAECSPLEETGFRPPPPLDPVLPKVTLQPSLPSLPLQQVSPTAPKKQPAAGDAVAPGASLTEVNPHRRTPLTSAGPTAHPAPTGAEREPSSISTNAIGHKNYLLTPSLSPRNSDMPMPNAVEFQPAFLGNGSEAGAEKDPKVSPTASARSSTNNGVCPPIRTPLQFYYASPYVTRASGKSSTWKQSTPRGAAPSTTRGSEKKPKLPGDQAVAFPVGSTSDRKVAGAAPLDEKKVTLKCAPNTTSRRRTGPQVAEARASSNSNLILLRSASPKPSSGNSSRNQVLPLDVLRGDGVDFTSSKKGGRGPQSLQNTAEPKTRQYHSLSRERNRTSKAPSVSLETTLSKSPRGQDILPPPLTDTEDLPLSNPMALGSNGNSPVHGHHVGSNTPGDELGAGMCISDFHTNPKRSYHSSSRNSLVQGPPSHSREPEKSISKHSEWLPSIGVLPQDKSGGTQHDVSQRRTSKLSPIPLTPGTSEHRTFTTPSVPQLQPPYPSVSGGRGSRSTSFTQLLAQSVGKQAPQGQSGETIAPPSHLQAMDKQSPPPSVPRGANELGTPQTPGIVGTALVLGKKKATTPSVLPEKVGTRDMYAGSGKNNLALCPMSSPSTSFKGNLVQTTAKTSTEHPYRRHPQRKGVMATVNLSAMGPTLPTTATTTKGSNPSQPLDTSTKVFGASRGRNYQPKAMESSLGGSTLPQPQRQANSNFNGSRKEQQSPKERAGLWASSSLKKASPAHRR